MTTALTLSYHLRTLGGAILSMLAVTCIVVAPFLFTQTAEATVQEWMSSPEEFFEDESIWAIAHGDGVFVAAGSDGAAAYSEDGINWTALTPGDDTGIKFGSDFNSRVYDIAYGNGMFVAVGTMGKASYSEDGINWTALTPGDGTGIKFGDGFTSEARSVAYGGGKFVVVGQNGMASYSEDGINWTALTPGDDTGIKFGASYAFGVTYGEGKFIAVGPNGMASYSEDGINWTALTPGTDSGIKFGTGGSATANKVAYGDGTFVVVGDNGKASYSEDGISWTALTPGDDTGIKFGTTDIMDITHGYGTFVVVGDNGKASYSEDGINWTALTPGDDTGIRFGTTPAQAVAYGSGTFVAAGLSKASYAFGSERYTLSFESQGGTSMEDMDGLEEDESVELPEAPIRFGSVFLEWNTEDDGDGISYDEGDLFSMPGEDTTLFAIWEEREIEGVVAGEWNILPPGDDTGIKFGSDGVMGITYGDGKFVAVGASGKASYSEDGINWTALTPGDDTGIKFGTTQAQAIAYGEGKFVAVGQNGMASYSEDGINWMALTPGDDTGIKFGEWNTIYSIAYGEGKFVAVGQSGMASYSEDGINWTALTPGDDTGIRFGGGNNIYSIAYGEGKFVAVGQNGMASYSEDGISWTALTPGDDTGIKVGEWSTAYAVAYGNGVFVVAAGNGGLLASYSEDGINWTSVFEGVSDLISMSSWPTAMAYGDGYFVLTASMGSAGYSADARVWGEFPAGDDIGIKFGSGNYSDSAWGVAYGNGVFVVVGESGKASYAYVGQPEWPEYVISFNTQGGSSVSSITGVNEGDSVSLPSAPQRSQYEFVNWNTEAGGGGIAYQPGATFVVSDSDVTLYAIWEQVRSSGSSGSSSSSSRRSTPSGGAGTGVGNTAATLSPAAVRVIVENKDLFIAARDAGISLPQSILEVLELPTEGPSGCPRYAFTRTLERGSEGEDVRELQRFLNCIGFTIASTGIGAPGSETIYFADLTHQALIRFQERYAADILLPAGLTSGTGVFGAYTIRKVHELMEGM